MEKIPARASVLNLREATQVNAMSPSKIRQAKLNWHN
jgi:hypothetical protein